MIGFDCHREDGLLGSIRSTLGSNKKVSNDNAVKGTKRVSDHSLGKILLDSSEKVRDQSCSICGAMEDTSCHQCGEEPSRESEGSSSRDGEKENSLAIVPVVTTDAGQQPELKPGWPLLHRKILSERGLPVKPFKRNQISVVQWAMSLPNRNVSNGGVDHDKQLSICDQGWDQLAGLNSQCVALVPVESVIGKTYSLPESTLKIIPKELEGLPEKYSSTCRLFEYQELVSATSNFLPGLFPSIIL